MKNVNAMLEVLFEGVQLKRWNGIYKSEEFVETSKQGLNAAIAYILAKLYEEKTGKKVSYSTLISLSICRMIYKTIFTDINPRISYRLLNGLKQEVSQFAMEKVKKLGFDEKFCDVFSEYLSIKDNENAECLELQIFQAASKLATFCEFKRIKKSGAQSYLLQKTEDDVKSRLEHIKSLEVVKDFMLDEGLNNFTDLYANTAFIKRWARFEMKPEVSDLSHMYMTAVVTFLFMNESHLSEERCVEGFYCGLFHDTLEILTGDLPYGLKKGIGGLKERLTEIELEEYDKFILPLLPDFIEEKMKKFILAEIQESNRKIMKAADNVCAYVEAVTSVMIGVSQDYFIQVIKRDGKENKDWIIEGIEVGNVYEYFYKKYLEHKNK